MKYQRYAVYDFVKTENWKNSFAVNDEIHLLSKPRKPYVTFALSITCSNTFVILSVLIEIIRIYYMKDKITLTISMFCVMEKRVMKLFLN